MRLEWRDGALTLRRSGGARRDARRLLPTDGSATGSRSTGSSASRASPSTFHADGDGRVTGVTIGPYSLQRFEPIGEPAVS